MLHVVYVFGFLTKRQIIDRRRLDEFGLCLRELGIEAASFFMPLAEKDTAHSPTQIATFA
jgi:hypothetical protein